MEDSRSLPDPELIRRWQQGDAGAFELLVRRWERPVGRFLARLVGRQDLVQDLSQEVFLRVFLAGATYRESGALSAWIYRIALNVARDNARRCRNQPVPLDDQDNLMAEDQTDALTERRELAGAVTQALGELSQPLREVLVLRHYEQMNFEQMARMLGVPASTLKSRFSLAIGKLRTRLDQLGWAHKEI